MNKYTKPITIKEQEWETTRCKVCGNPFRHNPRYPKPSMCKMCHNKYWLEKSNLAARKWRSKQKMDKYTIRQKNNRKTLKSPHKRFYSSPAWKWFSRYNLIINTIDTTGATVQCCTCGKWMKVNSRECHLGHYIKVFDGNNTNYAIAFVEADTGPQCLKCNKYMGGRQDEMAQWIKKKYGIKTLQELWEIKKLPLKLDDVYLKEIADKYRGKYYNYLREYNIQDPWKK
jgi:hypothetical protein